MLTALIGLLIISSVHSLHPLSQVLHCLHSWWLEPILDSHRSRGYSLDRLCIHHRETVTRSCTESPINPTCMPLEYGRTIPDTYYTACHLKFVWCFMQRILVTWQIILRSLLGNMMLLQCPIQIRTFRGPRCAFGCSAPGQVGGVGGQTNT